MKVDENGQFCLTKYATKNKRKSVKESYHNYLYIEVQCSWDSQFVEKYPRIELFNFSDKESFKNCASPLKK